MSDSTKRDPGNGSSYDGGYDVVVVGGGGAGLSCAAYAARAGLSTVLYEKQTRLGGVVQSVERNGFVFDMGLRAVESAGIILPMLDELGIALDYVNSPVSVGIADTIISLRDSDPLSAYRGLLMKYYPERRADVDRILSVVKRVMKHMDVLYGIENPLFRDPMRDRRYLFGTLLPWMFKFIFTIGKINRMAGPVEDLLEELSADPRLRSIIGQHFFKGTPAFFAMSYFSVYLDYFYPRGGTGRIMDLLASYARNRGLEVKTGVGIVRVDPQRQTVTDETGRSASYRNLVWCGDLKALHRAIDPPTIGDESVRRAVAEWGRTLDGAVGSDSVLSLFLAVDEPPESFHARSEGHFFYSPDADGLGDVYTVGLERLLAEYADVPLPVEAVKSYLRDYFARTTYEISIPVLKDPALAPHGKTGLIVSCLFDYRLTRRIVDSGWYEQLKEFSADTISTILAGRLYPDLQKKVLFRFLSTPHTIERQTGNTDGAITGWSFAGSTMPAVHKMQHVARSVRTPIPGVLQAGQWSYAPGGLPMAFLTGKLAANQVVKNLRRRARST